MISIQIFFFLKKPENRKKNKKEKKKPGKKFKEPEMKVLYCHKVRLKTSLLGPETWVSSLSTHVLSENQG